VGQKVSPIGFRVGVTLDWVSRWYVPSKQAFGECLVEDQKIRRFVDNKLNRQPPYAGVARIEVERTLEEVKVVIHTGRPGLVIGPRGAEVDKLRGELENLTGRKVNVEIMEVRNPDVDAQLVAEGLAQQLKRRSSFRRALKQRCEGGMSAGAKGIKIKISGRLGGAEMARQETQFLGSIPLQTLQANVDYGFAVSRTTYGAIGIRVWIYKGMFGEEVEPERRAPKYGRRAKR
jgi:small subunit ribosomal protein S3